MGRRVATLILLVLPSVAGGLAAGNRRKLDELLRRFARGGDAIERLCRAPWPCVADAPLRWLHFPKTGSTFTTTYTRYLCPSLPESMSIGKPVADAAAAATANRVNRRPNKIRIFLCPTNTSSCTSSARARTARCALPSIA